VEIMVAPVLGPRGGVILFSCRRDRRCRGGLPGMPPAEQVVAVVERVLHRLGEEPRVGSDFNVLKTRFLQQGPQALRRVARPNRS